MALTAGTRLGPYEITGAIGAGGMGEVYRATDTNLGRQVAIKVLPEAFAQDAERLARFDREARTLAALNHPNIAQIYGIERSNGVTALVMELVEGEDLSEVIARHGRGGGPPSPGTIQPGSGERGRSIRGGPAPRGLSKAGLPLSDALPIARQIAEALEAAHEQGIIHRDLKPANVKVRADGTVKVLDFGLAKAVAPTGTMSSSASMSPTITTPAMTEMGMILGTAAYMSPEQARGRAVDKRADIWAFGCVLYEMLTGTRAFEGEDISITLANVMKDDVSWEAVPPDVPAALRHLLRRCLEEDPKKRLRDMGEARLMLDGTAAFEPDIAPASAATARPPVPLWRRALPIVATAATAILITGLAAWALRPASSPRPVVRSTHALPEGRNFRNTGRNPVAIAPDGQSVAYNASGGLYLRRMDALADRVIAGAEASLVNPVFSPDGREVAYWQVGQIKRLAVADGVPIVIGPAESPLGMSWEADGAILFGQNDGIWRVAATGGTPERVIATEAGTVPSDPERLPGGDWVLFTLRRTGAGGFTQTARALWDEAEIVAVSLSSGERRVLRTGGTGARYVATGHLVYAVDGVLYAVPFDLDHLTVTGSPVPVVQGVDRAAVSGAAFYDVAADGTLAYVPGAPTAGSSVELAVIDRAGRRTDLAVDGTYRHPRVSPDGRRIAFEAMYNDGVDIAVYDVGTNTAPRRLTFGGGRGLPAWSADSLRVFFSFQGDDAPGLYWQVADGTSGAERLTTPAQGERHAADSASPDGRHLAFSVYGGAGEAAQWILSLQDREAQPLFATPGVGIDQAVFSPDGRWLAYQSNETGSYEVFVQPFPTTGAKYQLPKASANHHPVWSPDGRELFYVPTRGQFEAVSVSTQSRFTFGNPVSLSSVFGVLDQGGGSSRRLFDMMPDGSGFLTFSALATARATGEFRAVHIVQHWTEELKRLVPRP